MSQATAANPSDPDLIRACLDRDAAAWKELVERYGRLVYSIPLRCGLPAADADDVFQNVFFIVHRRLSTLKDHALLAPWLITVTQREVRRFQRRAPKDDWLDDTLADEGDAPLEQVQQWERQHAVRQALGQLEPRCREILNALFLDSEPSSYADLAKKLGVNPGSIGPNRARCFKKLQAILEAMGVNLDD
jgi:RNA polymerase sigma factor (sigma-70 family)